MAQRPKSNAAGTVQRTRKQSTPLGETSAKTKASKTKASKTKTSKTKASKTQASPLAKRPKAPPAKPAQTAAKPSSADAAGKAKRTAPKVPASSKIAAPKADAPRTSSKSPPEKSSARQAGKAKQPAPKAPAKTLVADTAVAKPAKRVKKASKDGTPAEIVSARTQQAAGKAKRPPPPYLAAELGQPVDHKGEPIGAGAAKAKSDTDLQDYTLKLWRQMQSGRVVNRYTRAIERAGLTVDEIWTAGVIDTRPTSSTPDEVRRYRQRLLFRANLLDAILSETVADLHRLDGIEPTPAETARESG